MNYRTKPPEIREIYNRLKQSAKKRKIEFDITLSDLNNISFPITCPVLDIPLRWNRGEPKEDSYSFDRIDSLKGYTIDNLQIISYKANRAKNNLTEEEIKLFCQYFG
jgi:hypothetical protein